MMPWYDFFFVHDTEAFPALFVRAQSRALCVAAIYEYGI